MFVVYSTESVTKPTAFIPKFNKGFILLRTPILQNEILANIGVYFERSDF